MKTIKTFILTVFVLVPFTGINSINRSGEVSPLEPFHYQPKTLFELVDSICKAKGVPTELVIEIGKNESNWEWTREGAFGDYGDLQVIPVTFDYWYKTLQLSGGKTRTNYLIVGIHYLKYQYDRYGSWRKARYAYGRGHWKNPSQWTAMERSFMRKIDFGKYDGL